MPHAEPRLCASFVFLTIMSPATNAITLAMTQPATIKKVFSNHHKEAALQSTRLQPEQLALTTV